VAQQVGRHGAGLMMTPSGQVAAQHRQRAFGIDGPGQRADDVVVEHLGAGDVLASVQPLTVRGRQVQLVRITFISAGRPPA
jgi:hypothetical protein